MRKLTNVWEFVAEYYPRYYSCDSIAYNEDLCKLHHEEYDEGDCAHRLLISDYGGEFTPASKRQIEIDFNESTLDIYERAIEAYIETINK